MPVDGSGTSKKNSEYVENIEIPARKVAEHPTINSEKKAIAQDLFAATIKPIEQRDDAIDDQTVDGTLLPDPLISAFASDFSVQLGQKLFETKLRQNSELTKADARIKFAQAQIVPLESFYQSFLEPIITTFHSGNETYTNNAGYNKEGEAKDHAIAAQKLLADEQDQRVTSLESFFKEPGNRNRKLSDLSEPELLMVQNGMEALKERLTSLSSLDTTNVEKKSAVEQCAQTREFFSVMGQDVKILFKDHQFEKDAVAGKFTPAMVEAFKSDKQIILDDIQRDSLYENAISQIGASQFFIGKQYKKNHIETVDLDSVLTSAEADFEKHQEQYKKATSGIGGIVSGSKAKKERTAKYQETFDRVAGISSSYHTGIEDLQQRGTISQSTAKEMHKWVSEKLDIPLMERVSGVLASEEVQKIQHQPRIFTSEAKAKEDKGNKQPNGKFTNMMGTWRERVAQEQQHNVMPPAPNSIAAIDQQAILGKTHTASKVTLLEAMLDDQPVTIKMLDDAEIKHRLTSDNPERSVVKLKQPVKERLTEQLFTSLEQEKSTQFVVHSSAKDKIVYADPSDPENKDKFITYIKEGNSWSIETGKQANAIIPNKQEKQLIHVKDGHIQSYGKGTLFTLKDQSQTQGKENQHPNTLNGQPMVEGQKARSILQQRQNLSNHEMGL